MIFAMSDFHAHIEQMRKWIDLIEPYLQKDGNKLLLLGDFIDRGRDSFGCLKVAYDLEQKYGPDVVICTKGNHEVWFEDFLFNGEDLWLKEDDNICTSGTFFTEADFDAYKCISDREEKIKFVRETIKKNHPDLIQWMRDLRLYYETETQIFVHAGVYEDISEEEIDWCTLGTPEEFFTGKYPPSRGHFYKDVIAGHVAASSVAHDRSFQGIYYDQASHFYIDGGVCKKNTLLCLAYDTENQSYYEMKENGSFKEIKRG